MAGFNSHNKLCSRCFISYVLIKGGEKKMPKTKNTKEKVIDNFKIHPKDTGSASVQIALLTNRINSLTEHLKMHTKDFSSRVGLLQLVSKRRRLLNYLKREDFKKYKEILEKLSLRK